MVSEEEDAQADALALRAVELASSGNLEEAHRALREGAQLAPENAHVKEAFTKVRASGNTSPLVDYCRKLSKQRDDDVARQAIRFVNQPDAPISQDVGEQCGILLIESHGSESPHIDLLLSLLLQKSSGCRSLVVSRLEESINNEFFEQLWAVGDRTMLAVVGITLNKSAWKSEETRTKCEKDIFMLLLAKLMEIGDNHDARGLKGMLQLLEADSERLADLIDEDSFQIILSMLDARSTPEVRSFATMTTAKIMEVRQDPSQGWLTSFVTARVSTGTNEDLILAFSTAAALFPVLTPVAAALFLTNGFVETLVPLLQKKAKSSRVVLAALEMFNAACVDSNCRDKISKTSTEWLEEMINVGTEHNTGIAAVILAKIRGTRLPEASKEGQPQTAPNADLGELVGRFKVMMSKQEDKLDQIAIEGLAYSSLQAKVKEQIAHDRSLLKSVLDLLKKSSETSSATFGCLSILANITTYLPRQSEEQKHLAQLKAYAKASKAQAEPDPLDADSKVNARCQAVLEAGVVPILVSKGEKLSHSGLSQALMIFLSLSRDQKHRGALVQQGAIKLLLSAYQNALKSGTPEAQTFPAAHAVARILISVNPALVFKTSDALSSIGPLVSLLKDDPSADQRDLLPCFESLLALTNIASMDDATRDNIVRSSWQLIEDRLLSNNTHIRRASVELVCNLMASPKVVQMFADGSPRSRNRLHIILALADVDDAPTRRAAGGGLAMLTEWDAAVDAVTKQDRGVKILLGLCQDEEQDIVHRGCVCIRNIVCIPGPVGKSGAEKVKQEGGTEALKSMLRLSNDPQVLEIGVEALKKLVEQP
ncbi:MAG: Cytochrome c oxidase assembly protein cox19 [Chaenotheca gracillima]|nr:MAG: Cytochrome c oxidase assembly protein cox19 [Chaenotheca gracillima]